MQRPAATAVAQAICGNTTFCRLVWSRYLHGKPALEATDRYPTCPNFMSNLDPGKVDGSFVEASIVAVKEFFCLEGSCHSTESQLGLLRVWLSDFHLSALSSELRVFLCFLVRETHVSATWQTLPIAYSNATYQNKRKSSSRQFRHMTS